MRFVLSDDDQLYTRMVELMLTDLGHQVVGVGITTADSIALVSAARPDVVILDPSLGINTDFDVIEASAAVGAVTIVFSRHADDAMLSQYEVRPVVVAKPDLTELQRVVSRLGLDEAHRVGTQERRHLPGRSATGRVPTGVGDAQAFYEALNEAAAGDALMSIEVSNEVESLRDTSEIATHVRQVMRDTDRLVASPWAVRVFLPGGDEAGARSLRSRLGDAGALPDGSVVQSVVLGPEESPAEAFDRLREMGHGS